MPIKGRLTVIKKQRIVAGLTEELFIKVLSTEMKRDSRTLATFIKNPNIKFRKDKDTRRIFFLGFFEKFVEGVVHNPSSTSAFVFAKAGVTPRFRQARYNVPNEMARNIKHILRLH